MTKYPEFSSVFWKLQQKNYMAFEAGIAKVQDQNKGYIPFIETLENGKSISLNTFEDKGLIWTGLLVMHQVSVYK